jgi:hypothetical protein
VSDQKPARESILNLALSAVEHASRNGGMIAAHTEAVRLLNEHPECSMSVDELRDEIARIAMHRGVGVEFGSPPDD